MINLLHSEVDVKLEVEPEEALGLRLLVGQEVPVSPHLEELLLLHTGARLKAPTIATNAKS